MPPSSMPRFWNQRAEEDPFYFVDNRMRYGDPNLAEFWSGGAEAVDNMLDVLEVELEPDMRMVEIGCGLGRITRALAERCADVRALDVSDVMLKQARELVTLGTVEWILGDGVSLSGIEDASADACFSLVVFQHIPDPEITLGYVAEMGRVLKPGGWAAVQISNDPSVHRPPNIGVRTLAFLRAGFGYGPRGQSHEAWLGSAIHLDRLDECARHVGLSGERIVGKGTQWCFVLLRKSESF